MTEPDGASPMKEEITQTKTITITLGEESIIVVRSHSGKDQNENDARENLEAIRQILGGKKACVLVDMRQTAILDKQARQVYATESDFALAQAMLVESAFTRISANLFIRVGHPVHPTRMFTSEEEAIAWLKGFLP